MPSIINASTINNGIVQIADASGVLELQGNGNTGLSISANGKILVPNIALSAVASSGMIEYDGTALYFTPAGTQRGVIPGMQYYRLGTGVVGTNATGAQSVLGVGVTLNASTVYGFQAAYFFLKTAGTTSHTLSTLFGGTATLNNIAYSIIESDGNGTWGSRSAAQLASSNVATATVVSGAMTAATQYIWIFIHGTVSVNAGGTLIPQYSLSAAPGGAYTTQTGSYFSIYPISAAGANTNVGTWA